MPSTKVMLPDISPKTSEIKKDEVKKTPKYASLQDIQLLISILEASSQSVRNKLHDLDAEGMVELLLSNHKG